MSKFEPLNLASSTRARPGLGYWNLYFILKFALQWGGYLNIQVLPNLLFAAFLLMPLSNRFAAIVRRLIAVLVAVALLYRDTWLPPLSHWMDWPSVADLSSGYLLALAESVVDWNLCGWLLVLVGAYLFVQPWLRMTTLTLAGLAWLSCINLLTLYPNHESSPAAPRDTVLPANAAVDSYLQQFYGAEADRRVAFEPSTSAAQPFDLLLINIDSIAWDDLDFIGLRDHPLLRQMDVLFDHFGLILRGVSAA